MKTVGGGSIAGVELGGTKTVAVLARDGAIVARSRLRTTTATETLGAVRGQLAEWHGQEKLLAVGIASFGPVRVRSEAEDYGCMLATPKPGWSGARIAQTLIGELPCPWRIDTDVNAAAVAEWRLGAGKGLNSLCYITLGTGVGGGIVVDGKPLHGALHPELGHLKPRRASDDRFEGICPFHGDCVEGLISGPALRARFGMAADEVADDDPRWMFVAHDLAQLIGAIALVASPQRVVVGGGIGLGRAFLLERTRENVVDSLAGYLPHITPETIRTFVTNPILGEDAGALGAVALGQSALVADTGHVNEAQHA